MEAVNQEAAEECLLKAQADFRKGSRFLGWLKVITTLVVIIANNLFCDLFHFNLVGQLSNWLPLLLL